MALINATDNDDTLLGSTAGDIINGLAGNDFIQGFDGFDTLFGGFGDNIL